MEYRQPWDPASQGPAPVHLRRVKLDEVILPYDGGAGFRAWLQRLGPRELAALGRLGKAIARKMKRRKWYFRGMKTLTYLILAVVLLAGCKKANRDVQYTVTCQSCDLTYSNSKGNTEQRTIGNSWSLRFDAEPGQFLYLSAQNNNANGAVYVSIRVDGKLLDDASSIGAYVIATASGSAP